MAFLRRGRVQLWASTEPRGLDYLGHGMGIREVWGQGAWQIVMFCLPLLVSCVCTPFHLFSPRLCYYFLSLLASRRARSSPSWPVFTSLTRGPSHCPGRSWPYQSDQGPSCCEHSNPTVTPIIRSQNFTGGLRGGWLIAINSSCPLCSPRPSTPSFSLPFPVLRGRSLWRACLPTLSSSPIL